MVFPMSLRLGAIQMELRYYHTHQIVRDRYPGRGLLAWSNLVLVFMPQYPGQIHRLISVIVGLLLSPCS